MNSEKNSTGELFWAGFAGAFLAQAVFLMIFGGMHAHRKWREQQEQENNNES